MRAGEKSTSGFSHLFLHVARQLSGVADVDEEGEGGGECAIHHLLVFPPPSRTPSRHFPTHAQSTFETMSRKIGRIGDWNNNSQSGSDRLVSWFYLFESTFNPNNHTRNNPSGPRIATLRDTTQPDPPARQHISDDEDDEESGRDQPESWFAGGERRSALIVSSTSIVPLILHIQVGYR